MTTVRKRSNLLRKKTREDNITQTQKMNNEFILVLILRLIFYKVVLKVLKYFEHHNINQMNTRDTF